MKACKLFKRKKVKGQLSIFAALIFQTLFILFAMSLNIALVVHDKINLQNSVDLAAYYGAMKQAEVLNAIAHINYQIRQSWKLMVWRNRVLGTIGSNSTPSRQGRPAQAIDRYLPPHTYKNQSTGPYVTCVGVRKWKLLDNKNNYEQVPSAGDDNWCNKMEYKQRLMNVPRFSGVLGPFVSLLNKATDQIIRKNKAIQEACTVYGYNSWFLAFFSVVYFHRDQSHRKKLIYKLANEILSKGKDLDGNNIDEGAWKTFFKNLTFINSQYASKNHFKTLNSLEGKLPNEWLKDTSIPALPLYAHIKAISEACQIAISHIASPEAPPQCNAWQDPLCQAAYPLYQQIIYRDSSDNICTDSNNLCKMSAGIYKNKNFTIYFKASAELEYKNQIFMPSGPIALRAKAFAKPFGASIGPAHGVDRLLPHYPSGGGSAADAMVWDRQHAPNYSRYPGDKWGLRSEYVHHIWSDYLERSSTSRDMHNYLFHQGGENASDILAKHYPSGQTQNIIPRSWELAAIAPDLFDVSYFTIMPHYMDTYYPKILLLFRNHYPFFEVRKDLGYEPTRDLKWQIKSAWRQLRRNDILPDSPGTVNRIPVGNPFYNINELDQILTSWQAPHEKYIYGKDEYYPHHLNRFPFSKCAAWGTKKKKIASGCYYGGRSGYSVKLVSEDSVN